MRSFHLAILSFGAVALTACGEGITNPDFDGTARVSIDNLTVWGVVSGTVEVQATPMMEYKLAKLELLRSSDGQVAASTTDEPFTLTWDTTGGTDGVDTVWVRATDKADSIVESPMVNVIVLNQGLVAPFVSGENGGEVYIPSNYNGTQEVDLLQHWNNPAGVHSILAILNWSVPEGQTSWDVGLSVGRGICPHRGTQYGPEPSATQGPIVLKVTTADVSASMTEFPATGPVPDPLVDQYFVHLRPNNPGDHRGEAMNYRVDVFLLK